MFAALSSPLTRYRIMAYVTGVVLVILVCVAMPLKYLGDDDRMVAVVGTLHGWLYLFYVLATVNLAYVRRWSLGRSLLVVLAGTIPFAVFFVEHRIVAETDATGPAQAGPGRQQEFPDPQRPSVSETP